MTRKLNTFVIVVLTIIATLLHGSIAQTKHVVGDSTGWAIPSAGAATYTTWASNKTFTLGDTLVFNFTNGQHDVAKVTKSGFDACNGGNAFFTLTASPATVTLNETGDQYYICAFSGHCSAGQKLAIKVTQKASTTTHSPAPLAAPAPSTKVPESAPAPAPAPSSATSTTSPSPSPTNAGGVSPPPQNSGAASLGSLGVYVFLLSIATVFY